jgi:hypothetical protein
VLGGEQERISLGTAAERAVQQSQLTLPGSKPFHLKATIREENEPDSDYQGKIEEYWAAPTKWRRTIESPEFSQTVIVNGTEVSEKNEGDYFPVWLNKFVTALFDPLPMLSTLQGSNVQIPKPRGGENATICGDLHARVDRWVICFEGSHGLLSSVFTKGYAAEFKEYKKFGDKRVAHRMVNDPEPGTKLEERITELTEMGVVDDSMFEVNEPTPAAQRVRSIRISEEEFRSMALNSTEIEWPAVGGGPEKGGCAVYASADRMGQVREVWPGGCDNAGLEGLLRETVKKWRLKPPVADGAPVQVEALLGFAFQTSVYKQPGPPELSNNEARALASNIVEPDLSGAKHDKGGELSVEISVDETGKLAGIQNIEKLGNYELLAINKALSKWRFRPYVKDGKPQYFHAKVVFRVR